MVDAAVEGRRAGTSASTGSTVWAVLATSFGNLIEWYDVYAYSAFALYFAGSFFPKNDAAVQQLQAATLFAIAFLMRPFGSMIFGYLADRYGRRSSLTVSILAMCFGSALIAVSPTYDAIGIWAAVILSVARIIQGLSQGGEYGTSVTYLSEISPPESRGFYSGVWYVTLIGGQLAAVLLLFVLQKLFLTPDQLKSWGWRIPFAIGALASLYGFRMRAHLPESEKFVAAARTRRPFGELLAQNWRNMLVVIFFNVWGTSEFYTYTTYMQKYLKLSVGLSDISAPITLCRGRRHAAGRPFGADPARPETATVTLLILILVVILLFGGGGFYGYRGGYYGNGGIGIVGLIGILIILYLLFGGGFR